MKLKFLFGFIIFFTSALMYGQGEGSYWYFGKNAGVNFNNNTVNEVTDGQLATNEGCATISDSKGELLFYTDGVTVWDKTHKNMPNGINLLGNGSSTQSAIIVPKPNSSTIYYIFTVIDAGRTEGLRYTEVDLTLNNGNGDITSNKNILLTTPCAEKISAVKHANGIDFWVATHSWNGSDFVVFKVTENGVETTPVTSSIGSFHGGDANNSLGYMKFSPNGKKIAVAKWSVNSFVEIFDFNSNTGVVSNAININSVFGVASKNGAYGVEFSPNSKLLYVTEIDFDSYSSKLHQLNLNLFTKNDIENSAVLLYDGKSLLSAAQLAVNGKIYICNSFTTYLDIIENPNSIGFSCGYLNKGLNIRRQTVFGLPTFIQSFFVAKIETDNSCFMGENQFSVQTDETIDSVIWDFGDSTTSTLLNPTHTYSAPGTYTVKVQVQSGYNVINAAKELIVYDTPEANIATDYVICKDYANNGSDTFDLQTKTIEILGNLLNVDFEVTYFSSFADATIDKNALPRMYVNIQNDEEIFAKVVNRLNPECFDISSFLLTIETIIAGPVDDLVLCDDKTNNGITVVDLDQFEGDVSNGIFREDLEVTYYYSQTDADLGTSAISPTNIEIKTKEQAIYARLESLTTGCFSTTNFKIIINETVIAYQPDNMYLCDDVSNDEKETFNLQIQTAQILKTQTGKVTYHISQNDADAGINAINENFENQSNPQQIFARAESLENASCYSFTSFYIEVSTEAIIDIIDIWYICPGEDVRLYVNSVHDDYKWSTGETSSEIVVNKAGDYTVTVSDVNVATLKTSCSVSKTIQVVESEIPNKVYIEINDLTDDRNSLQINVDGISNYQFSIDGNTYQDSNFFDNLASGDYRVYVSDESGCVVYFEDIYLLSFPKFFTPNNDGYNDFWNIDFSETEQDIEIFIYDRYGKLITKLDALSKGWDGTMNGQSLITSDYWFVLNRPSKNKQHKGHFTLKR